jgi:hypothetical protein
VPDFLHHLKNFCNKVKNHPVAIRPELPEDILTCQDLASLFDFGNVFSDRLYINQMCNLDALKLSSLANWLDCMDKDSDLVLMYFLPWAPREDIIRNPRLPQKERLEKAILSFDLLLHDFDL